MPVAVNQQTVPKNTIFLYEPRSGPCVLEREKTAEKASAESRSVGLFQPAVAVETESAPRLQRVARSNHSSVHRLDHTEQSRAPETGEMLSKTVRAPQTVRAQTLPHGARKTGLLNSACIDTELKIQKVFLRRWERHATRLRKPQKARPTDDESDGLWTERCPSGVVCSGHELAETSDPPETICVLCVLTSCR